MLGRLRRRLFKTHNWIDDGRDYEGTSEFICPSDVKGLDVLFKELYTIVKCIYCKFVACCEQFTEYLSDKQCSIFRTTSDDNATNLAGTGVIVKFIDPPDGYCTETYTRNPAGNTITINNVSPEDRIRIHSRLEVLASITGYAINQKIVINGTPLAITSTSPVMTAGVPVSFMIEDVIQGLTGSVQVRVQTNLVAGAGGVVNLITNASTLYIEKL